jgi:tetratricopeptide (TPR) repeat protein
MRTLQLSLILTTIFVLSTQWSFSQNLNQRITREDGQQDLLGLCERAALLESPFKEWFETNYEGYQVDEALLGQFDRDWEEITVDIFMGTWCGDSKREVPRFYKILDALSFPEDHVRLINVDKTPEAYKQSPGHEESGKLIHRVPTFIIYREGKEIGRIVEYPVTSLEMDLLQIFEGLPSSPRYKVVHLIDAHLEEHGVPSDDQGLLELARKYYKEACGDKALNTYGYYLMYKGELEKAIAVLRINALYFRDVPNVYDSLGEAYLKNGEPEKALRMYQKVLSFDNNNENAKKQIEQLEKRND